MEKAQDKPQSFSPAPVPTPNQRPSTDSSSSRFTFLMRAGEGFWEHEVEENAKAGKRRAFRVYDEEYAHIVRHDRVLSTGELLTRAEALVSRLKIPVKVSLERVAWASNPDEVRERVVAALQTANASDVKMVLGVDYFGGWASVWIGFGMEPGPLPAVKVRPPNYLAYAMLILGILTLPICIGVFFLIAYAMIIKKAKETATMDQVKAEAHHRRVEVQKFLRNYRFDDMRLFKTAMTFLFQEIVDDMVDRGGKIVRIEANSGLTQPKHGAVLATPGQELPSVDELGL